MKSRKKSFALLTTILFITIFSALLYLLHEQKSFFENLNKLKYLNLQAYMHFNKIKHILKDNREVDISTINLNDDRFSLAIYKNVNDLNQTTFTIDISSTIHEPIRMYETIYFE